MSTNAEIRAEAPPVSKSKTNGKTNTIIEKSWLSVAWEIAKHPIRAGLGEFSISLGAFAAGLSSGDRAVLGMSAIMASLGAYKLKRFVYMQRHVPPYPAIYGFG